MTKKYKNLEEYIFSIPDNMDAVGAFLKINNAIDSWIPKGFETTFIDDMLAYVVPLATYPDGHQGDPTAPLQFCRIALRKNEVALYHHGLNADWDLYSWFKKEYRRYTWHHMVPGKDCIRFLELSDIPEELVCKLMQKMTVQDWIALYEKSVKKN